TLEVTLVVDAPRELVFRAWTEPEQMARWWGPKGFTTTGYDIDVRPGGRYRACMRAPDGREHCRSGTYREITPPEQLVFTFAWLDEHGGRSPETLVTVRFAALGAKTRIMLRQALFTTSAARD